MKFPDGLVSSNSTYCSSCLYGPILNTANRSSCHHMTVLGNNRILHGQLHASFRAERMEGRELLCRRAVYYRCLLAIRNTAGSRIAALISLMFSFLRGLHCVSRCRCLTDKVEFIREQKAVKHSTTIDKKNAVEDTHNYCPEWILRCSERGRLKCRCFGRNAYISQIRTVVNAIRISRRCSFIL